MTSKKSFETGIKSSGGKSRFREVLNSITSRLEDFCTLIFIRLPSVKLCRSSSMFCKKLEYRGRICCVRSWNLNGRGLLHGSSARKFFRLIFTAQEWSSTYLTEKEWVSGLPLVFEVWDMHRYTSQWISAHLTVLPGFNKVKSSFSEQMYTISYNRCKSILNKALSAKLNVYPLSLLDLLYQVQ